MEEWYKHIDEHPIAQKQWMNDQEWETYWSEYDKKSNRIIVSMIIVGAILAIICL